MLSCVVDVAGHGADPGADLPPEKLWCIWSVSAPHASEVAGSAAPCLATWRFPKDADGRTSFDVHVYTWRQRPCHRRKEGRRICIGSGAGEDGSSTATGFSALAPGYYAPSGSTTPAAVALASHWPTPRIKHGQLLLHLMDALQNPNWSSWEIKLSMLILMPFWEKKLGMQQDQRLVHNLYY
jgi:hypothetical protein